MKKGIEVGREAATGERPNECDGTHIDVVRALSVEWRADASIDSNPKSLLGQT
jgi:hypothetical protein